MFCLFVIFNCSVYSQSISEDKAVMSPFIDFDKMFDPDVKIVKRHDPFDNATLLTPKFGAQVYSDEEIIINMFAIAFSEGDVNSYHPEMGLGLLFLAYNNSENSNEISLANGEIIFLIENERHVKNIDEHNVVSFNNPRVYQNLATSDEVRARISINQNNYEIDLGMDTRIIVNVLLSEITPQ